MVVADRFSGRFTILSEAKRGGTASVFKALDHESEAIVALKIFQKEGRDQAIVNEIWNREHTALSKLTHPSIVRFVAAGRSEDTSERWIALEWLDGSTLESWFVSRGAMSWSDFFQSHGEKILQALTFAAEKNVIHRDLSTSNVLVSAAGVAKIIDFGQAKISELGIGLTVKDFRTAPYCPPEEDTGRHTQTRDPFAYCAICIRAVSGRKLSNHDELYDALAQTKLPEHVDGVVRRALSRVPTERFPTIIEFERALGGQRSDEGTASEQLRIFLRMAPAALDQIASTCNTVVGNELLEEILCELNEVASVTPVSSTGGDAATKLKLETRSYRLFAVPDGHSPSQLVVTGGVVKQLRVDAMFHSDRWIPHAQFIVEVPRTPEQRMRAREDIERLYEGLDAHLAELKAAESSRGDRVFEKWEGMLEALRFIARNSVAPLSYSHLEKEGSRLIASVANPQDATEEEYRVIVVDRSWVFRGEVESIRDGKCVLASTRQGFTLDRIPSSGQLELDWVQTRMALDRQSFAVEQFKQHATPSSRLEAVLTGRDAGPATPTYAAVSKFFDKELDAAKKAVVSRFMGGTEILVTHGPPGTGKTKLIVELIRQIVSQNPDAQILLASQTHVALDNALRRLLDSGEDISCVRIGSGSREVDTRVASFSLERRSEKLRAQVAASARSYLESRAVQAGIDSREVELGLAVLELTTKARELARTQQLSVEADASLQALQTNIETDNARSTSERSSLLVRLRVLEEESQRLASDIVVLKAEQDAARKTLASFGSEGVTLASQPLNELEEWAEVLLHDDRRRALGELMKLSEQWKLRFGQSDDFRAAIISSSSVVAGTCVGFCREESAQRMVFDVCIIDEAGKATTTELLVPLARSRRAVLFGDHHQLPAVLDYEMKSPDLQRRFGLTRQDFEQQLFEQLAKGLGEGCIAALTVQYRMRGEIGRLVSECFYEGTLQEDDSISGRVVPDLTLAGLPSEVTWIDPYVGAAASSLEKRRITSYENLREVDAILALLRRLALCFTGLPATVRWPTIGVISGYASQVNKIRADIRRVPGLDRLEVECASVHAFQGREVDICIYSVTRKNPEFQVGMLKDWRHLNVALSRARNFLVIVGSREFCRHVPLENRLGQILRFVEESPTSTVMEWGDV
jgi:serine/threonine protein kinase